MEEKEAAQQAQQAQMQQSKPQGKPDLKSVGAE